MLENVVYVVSSTLSCIGGIPTTYKKIVLFKTTDLSIPKGWQDDQTTPENVSTRGTIWRLFEKRQKPTKGGKNPGEKVKNHP